MPPTLPALVASTSSDALKSAVDRPNAERWARKLRRDSREGIVWEQSDCAKKYDEWLKELVTSRKKRGGKRAAGRARRGLVERSKSAPAPHARSSSSLPAIVRPRNESGDTSLVPGRSKAPHQLSGKALSQCTFRNLAYAASGPQPLGDFFRHVPLEALSVQPSSSAAGATGATGGVLRVPPTLVLSPGKPVLLLGSTVDGRCMRRMFDGANELLSGMDALAKVLASADADADGGGGPAAVIKLRRGNATSNELELIPTRDALRSRLVALLSAVSAGSSGGDGGGGGGDGGGDGGGGLGLSMVVQRFVRPRGATPWIVRAVWRRAPKAAARSEAQTRAQARAPLWVIREGAAHVTDSSAGGDCRIYRAQAGAEAGAASWSEPRELLTLLAGAIHARHPAHSGGGATQHDAGRDGGSVALDEMAADWLQDDAGRWWLLQVKAFRLHNPAATGPVIFADGVGGASMPRGHPACADMERAAATKAAADAEAAEQLKKRNKAWMVQQQLKLRESKRAFRAADPKTGKRCAGEYCAGAPLGKSGGESAPTRGDKGTFKKLPFKMVLVDRFLMKTRSKSEELDEHPSAAVRLQHFMRSLGRRERNQIYDHVGVCARCYSMYTQRQRAYDAIVEADAALQSHGQRAGAAPKSHNAATDGDKENTVNGAKEGHSSKVVREAIAQGVGVVAREMSHLDDEPRKSAVTKTGKDEEHGDEEPNLPSAGQPTRREPQSQSTPTPKEPRDPKLISFVDRAVAGQLLPDVPTESSDAGAATGTEQLDSEIAAAEQKLRDAVQEGDFAKAAEIDDMVTELQKRKDKAEEEALLKRMGKKQRKGANGTAADTPTKSAAQNAAQSAAQSDPVVRCAWGCGARLPASLMQKHEDDQCIKREVLCPFGCDVERVTLEGLEEHKRQCPRRPVRCSLGCGAKFPADMQQVHISTMCELRCVPCRVGCGKTIPFKDRAKHETDACPQRIVACPRGCGRSLIARIVHDHAKQCDGSLPLLSLSSLKCAAVFADEALKQGMVDRAKFALDSGSRVLLSAELRENNRSAEDCQLMLRSLYMELRHSCVDLGFLPEVLIEGGGPRGGGVAMLELRPTEKALAKLANQPLVCKPCPADC